MERMVLSDGEGHDSLARRGVEWRLLSGERRLAGVLSWQW